jgi:CBS domain containing-hemolysin-like protein
MKEIVYWSLITLLCIALEAFFTMSEMSFVSFDKVRLHFLQAKGSKKAKLLLQLLQKPIYLFGTTLIGVNFALVSGSESSRRLYHAIGLPESLAPITQVLLVVIFAELSPLFAARRHFQSVAFFCVPVIYFFSKVLYPLLLLISLITKGLNLLLKGKKSFQELALTRDELQNILERVSTKKTLEHKQLHQSLINNIFKLKTKSVVSLVNPLNKLICIPKRTSVQAVKEMLKERFMPYILVFDKTVTKIIKVVFTKELVDTENSLPIEEMGQLPWFVDAEANTLELLKQLKVNTHFVAVILDSKAQAMGTIQIEDILGEIFPKAEPRKQKLMQSIQRTVSAKLTVEKFNHQFQTKIDAPNHITLFELMLDRLGHVPKSGDSITIDHLEITLLQKSIFSTKRLLVKSLV